MTLWDEPLSAVFRHLIVRPDPAWPEAITGRHWATYVSVTSYVGPVVLCLVLLSLARGPRWWHRLVLVSGWLAIGSTQWYHPSYWLFDWPFFASAARGDPLAVPVDAGTRPGGGERTGPLAGFWTPGRVNARRRPDAGHRRRFPGPGLATVADGMLRPPRAAMVPRPAGPGDRQRRRRDGFSLCPAGYGVIRG